MEGARRGAWRVYDLQWELVVVGGGRRKVAASLREPAVREAGSYWGAEEEAQRHPFSTLAKSLQVGEGEVRASLVEGWVAVSLVWDLQGPLVEGVLHGSGSSGLVEGCWVQEEERLLECLVWMRNLGGPWGVQVRCYGEQPGLLGV